MTNRPWRAPNSGRLEASEEVLVTVDGREVLTGSPANELLVTGRTYVRGADVGGFESRRRTGQRAGEPSVAVTLS